MSDSTLYDDDILLWSEQQAAAIRKLGAARDLPNELDIENVAEEVEGVGRWELAAVESYLRLIFLHLIKLSAEADAPAARHWRSEVVGFHSDMMTRHAPSMRQRLDLDAIWGLAREQLMLAYDGAEQRRIAELPERRPFDFDDLLARRIDRSVLVTRL